MYAIIRGGLEVFMISGLVLEIKASKAVKQEEGYARV